MSVPSTTAGDECPTARPSTVHSRALHVACRLLGGEALLAKYLGVTQDQLLRWLEAHETPPQALFLKAVHVILSQWDRRDDVMAAARKE